MYSFITIAGGPGFALGYAVASVVDDVDDVDVVDPASPWATPWQAWWTMWTMWTWWTRLRLGLRRGKRGGVAGAECGCGWWCCRGGVWMRVVVSLSRLRVGSVGPVFFRATFVRGVDFVEQTVRPPDLPRLFRTLSDETRFRLLRLLWREELTVNELASITQLAQPRISNHLKILREEGLITERRDGSWRHYRVDVQQHDEQVQAFWPLLEAFWQDEERFGADDKRLAEVVAGRVERPRGAFFDELAEHWDDIRTALFGDALGREVLKTFLPPGLVVADIGTGTGYVLHLFGNRAKKLIAIDNSEAMLGKAEANARAAGLRNVEFRLADAEQTPLGPEEVNVITVIQVLHHLADPGRSLASLAGGLQPGGRIIVSDLLEHQESWLCEKLNHRWSGFSRGRLTEWIRGTGLGIESFEVLPGRMYTSPDGHRQRIPDGFTAVLMLSRMT